MHMNRLELALCMLGLGATASFLGPQANFAQSSGNGGEVPTGIVVNSKYLVPSFMVVYTCKKCGELNYLTPHAFWNITDFRAKCERCETINTITLESEELKKQD
jgi:phage FluMu protein Com